MFYICADGSISNGRNYAAWKFSTWINYASAEPQVDVQLSIDQITISQDICFSNAEILITRLSLITQKFMQDTSLQFVKCWRIFL